MASAPDCSAASMMASWSRVGVGGAGGADVVRLVGVANVARVFVGVAVDGDGVDAEFLAGPHHADRDFAAVGDEYLLEHSWSWILETAY